MNIVHAFSLSWLNISAIWMVFAFWIMEQSVILNLSVYYGMSRSELERRGLHNHLPFSPSHLEYEDYNYRMIQQISQGHLNISLSWLMGLVTFVWSWESRVSSNTGGAETCRPIDHAYWFLFQTPLDVSMSWPLNEKWAHMCLTLTSVTVSFLFWERKLPLLSQWSTIHVYGSKLHLSTDTNAPTPCSANVTPIQLNAWVMPLPTRDSQQ